MPIEVIDGEREAALTFRAVVESFPETRRGEIAVVDIGGGSTEVVTARDGRPTSACSLPLGSVRLTEQHIRHDPATREELAGLRAAVTAGLSRIAFTPAPPGRGCGTVTSLAAMAESMATYDPARVHGYRLSQAALEARSPGWPRAGRRTASRSWGWTPAVRM